MVDEQPSDAREIARQALEGQAWTEKREHEAQLKGIKTETDQITDRLKLIAKEKEKLELTWIELDGGRKVIRKNLEPLLTEEKRLETEEMALEAEEAKIGLAKDKQMVEKKRWLVQQKRQDIEQKKWSEEDKLGNLDQTIENNTKAYRALLDEEEKLEARLAELRATEAAL